MSKVCDVCGNGLFQKSSFSFSDVRLFKAAVALYYVNDVFGVAVDVMGDRPGFICRVECA